MGNSGQNGAHMNRAKLAAVLVPAITILVLLAAACIEETSPEPPPAASGVPVFAGSESFPDEVEGRAVLIFEISIADQLTREAYTGDLTVEGTAFTPAGESQIRVSSSPGLVQIVLEAAGAGDYAVLIESFTNTDGETFLPFPDGVEETIEINGASILMRAGLVLIPHAVTPEQIAGGFFGSVPDGPARALVLISLTIELLDSNTGKPIADAAVNVRFFEDTRSVDIAGNTDAAGMFSGSAQIDRGELNRRRIEVEIQPPEDIELAALGCSIQVNVLGLKRSFLFQGPNLHFDFTLGGPQEFSVTYWNWTDQVANDFHLEFVQSLALDPGESPPPVPTVETDAFKKRTGPETKVERDETAKDGSRRIKRRVTYWFTGGSVPPGGSIKITVKGEGIVLADGVVAIWTNEEDEHQEGESGAEIDRSKTDSLMCRKGLTSSPPEGANDIHLEYKDAVAGVWVEPGKGNVKISKVDGDEYPYKVDFTEIDPPFDFKVDFASEAKDNFGGQRDPRRGARLGRMWWTIDGNRVGDISEGG